MASRRKRRQPLRTGSATFDTEPREASDVPYRDRAVYAGVRVVIVELALDE
jgi:hypothetical protein